MFALPDANASAWTTAARSETEMQSTASAITGLDELKATPGYPDDEAFAETAAYTISRNNGESLRTARWRYNLWNDGKTGVELYDQKNHPGEFHTLADDPKHAEVRAALDKRLKACRTRAATSSIL